MNFTFRVVVAVFTLLLTHLAYATDLVVVAKTPFGSTVSPEAVRSITATFNQPMVALQNASAMGDFCPITIEPKLKGRCRWLGTQVLSFEPNGPLPVASRFTATIPSGTASRVSHAALAHDEQWTFDTVRPGLLSSVPVDNDKWIALRPLLFVHFNLTMDWKKAATSITLQETDLQGGSPQTIAVAVRRAKADEVKNAWPYAYFDVAPSTSNVLVVVPTRALKPDHAYDLHLGAGLLAGEGTLGLENDRDVHFETWYTFQFKEAPGTRCVPGYFPFSLSNPVAYNDLMSHMKVIPSTPIPLQEGNMSTGQRDPQKRLVTFSLAEFNYQPDTQYQFTIDHDLKDIFGNRLGTDATFTVNTGGYCPYIEMPEGFGILEAGLPPRHPLTLLNVPQTTVEIGSIKDDAVVALLNHSNGWRQRRTDVPSLTNRQWVSRAPHNKRWTSFIDFSPWVRSTGGMVFAQVEVPPSETNSQAYWMESFDDVTRIGVTFKNGPDNALFWTTYLKTGSPAPRIAVELRSDANVVLWRGLTDAHGFVTAPGWKALGLQSAQRERPTLWAFAKDPQGTAILSTQFKNGIEPWRFGVPYDYAPKRDTYQGSLFTDRGIYRPGETVNFKGLVRKLEQGDWVNSDLRRVQLTLTDARGSEVFRSTFTLSAASSFATTYAINEHAPTGFWTAQLSEPTRKESMVARPVESDEEDEDRNYQGHETAINVSVGFRVEAFKPASFEVHAMPQQSSYLLGDTFHASVEGWYLFGAPMSGATAEWSVGMVPSLFAPSGLDDYYFNAQGQNDERGEPVVGASKGVLDSKGGLSVDAPLKATGHQPYQAVLEASVSSPDRQRLFGRASVMVHPSTVYVGLKPSTSFTQVGKPWSASVIAVHPDGSAILGQSVTVQLKRHDYLSVERAGLAGRLEWENQERETFVSSATVLTTASTATWTVSVDHPGQYEVTIFSEDPQHRSASASTWFYATGAGDSWWSRNDTDLIEVVADKKSYKPGDIARLLVKSPYAHTRALITIEREGILDHWLTTLDGNASLIEVPVKDRYLPNVFVGVMLIQGRSGTGHYAADGDDLAKPQAKFGYVNLPVDPGGRRLSVHVTTDKKEYRPRQSVSVNVQSVDDKGNPAPAEITLYAVDEGVLSLTGYETPNIFDAFYGPRPLAVETVDSRLHIIGQRDFGEKGENRGGGGGKRSALEGIDLRSRFVPTAFWAPTITTDASGHAQGSFTLPDNLSRFRVMAVAHDINRFGSGDTKLTVSKPLLLRASVPRLARVGDHFQGGAVVHNYTAADATVDIALELKGAGIEADGPHERQVLVRAGQAVEVLWPCKATTLGKTSFQIRAKAGVETDGLDWPVSVVPGERLETVATTGVTADQTIEKVGRPTDGVLTGATVQLSLSPSALSGLQDGAQYLLGYPYGCLEQQMSRSLPVIVGADLIGTFGLGTVGDLKTKVQSVLDHVLDYQHPSGGFGYWPSPWQPDPFITAYALEVCHLAAKAEYRVPTAVLDRAVAWLKVYLSSERQWAYPYNDDEKAASRAYAVYVLALYRQAPANYFMPLYQRRDQLPFVARAYLAKAAPLILKGSPIPRTLNAELLNQSRLAPTTMHFEDPSERQMPWIHETTVGVTALMLQTLLEVQGGFANDEKVIRWLVEERKGKGRWRTTQENALSLWAFQDYYKRYEPDAPDFTSHVELNSTTPAKTLWSEVFHGRTLVTRERSWDASTLFGSAPEASLAFKKEGTGRLYYGMRMQYEPAPFTAPDSEGFEIRKTITPLVGHDKTLKAGSRAVVTITVKTLQDRIFVSVNDPLPAGFEIVDPSFATEGQEDARKMELKRSSTAPDWGGFQRSENYDDRILIFSDFLSAGEHTYSYLVQATTPGDFASPATVVEQMYEPEVFGRTASSRVEIQP